MNERKDYEGKCWILIPLAVIIFCAVLSSCSNGGMKLIAAGLFHPDCPCGKGEK